MNSNADKGLVMSNGDAHKPPLPPTNLPRSDVQRVIRIFVGQSNICEVTLGQEKG